MTRFSQRALPMMVLGIIVSLATGAINAAAQVIPTYRISKGTEHKIWLHPGGATACFSINSAATGAPARAHFRRTRAGKGKDLDTHTGSACWKAKAPVYVLYASAVDEDIIVRQTSGPAAAF